MSIKVQTNLETLAKDIGAYLGIAEGLSQKEYMKSLIRTAHAHTLPEFLSAAAKAAKAPDSNIKHMYEFGVAGITRGDKKFINPMLPAARLWRDVIVGEGGQQKISFTFRPAVNRVPKHTTESTGGVPQAVLDRLKLNQGKRYVFQHRAEVYEQGIAVNIFPKKSTGRLFVPDNEAPSKNTESPQGFSWQKSLHYTPGLEADTVGAFQAFFFNWWSVEGGRLMANDMDRKVSEDVKKAEVDIEQNKGMLKPPAATNVVAASDRAKVAKRKQFTVWAQQEDGHMEQIL